MGPIQSAARRFTLVELMITIGIVALLAAIAVPIMTGMQMAAKRSEALPNASAIRVAQLAYAATYDTFAGSYDYVHAPRSYTMFWWSGYASAKRAVPWSAPAGSAFDLIGWVPDGPVRCGYATTGFAPWSDDLFVHAICNVDADSMGWQNCSIFRCSDGYRGCTESSVVMTSHPAVF